MTHTWLYAVAPAGPDPLPPDLPGGVADEGPRTVTADGLLAVVGSVPTPDFDSDTLQRHLGEPQWLERTARAHHRVVSALGGRALPVRYGTVYRDDDRVRALLTAHADGFRAALAGIADRTEWGVKAYQDRTDPDEGDEEDGAPEDRPGTAYLLRRRSARDRADRALADAAERARQVHRTLAGLADRSTEHPPQPPEATGVRDPMLLNGAYLVHRSRAAEFARAVTGLQRLHGPVLRVELTGPWPPYSFADLPIGPSGPSGGDAE
ncbi:gas vesicle protein [Kitasatospora phosalacinea]|uniref:Gas vesicle protein n=1 Tax=Kitasatospora phosalacinea TaxID=2065 RepID=A0A9W6QD94_9ACTN|nr:GvpL/GvpF family gas vesicle protein [Kitasatospora phosalacinea]GLW72861.1 gas vesicle protein [Kitasatospora phosalacinea]